MTRKSQFILFLYLRAMAQDIATGSANTLRIVDQASRIPDGAIPAIPENAAAVYVSAVTGNSRPFRWMRAAGIPDPSAGRGKTAK